MTLPAGTRLGPYEILAPIGAGGMGEVYRARDTRLAREVAVKVLPAAVSADPERLKRFEKEARSASSLNHPNIVTIHDIGESAGTSFIAMELVDGQTLREILAEGAVPTKRLLAIAAQAADGLAKAHGAGIVHRDLKPENIMVTKDGFVKILDFGLAKLIQPEDSDGRTQAPTVSGATAAGIIMGTVGYMSPEQAAGRATDFRSDQFSFGSILYEMATGKRAFMRATSAETLAAIIREEPEPIGALQSRTPGPLRWIVERCLSKEVRGRYASTEDLARELEVVRDHLSDSAFSGERLDLVGRPRRRFAFGLVTALSAIGALAAGVFLGRLLWTAPGSFSPSLRRLTFGRGAVSTARFSPDGQTVYYSAGIPPEIFVVRPESPESRPLGFPKAGVLSISSTGGMALVLNWEGGVRGGTLAQAPLTGGVPREILEKVLAADWSPDGRLAVAHQVGARCRLEFPVGKTLYENQGFISSLRVSQDGNRIAFLDHPLPGDDAGSVAVVDLSGKTTRLSSGWTSANGLAWSPRSSELWFAATEKEDPRSLRAVTLSGRQRVLYRAPTVLTLHDVSREGTTLVSTGTFGWKMVGFGPDGRERDLSWLDWSQVADVSADGQRVLFTVWGESAKPAVAAVYLRRTDGSPAVRLGDGIAMALSPDGKWALCARGSAWEQRVLMPTGPGQPKTVPLGRILADEGAVWYPDGKRILFAGHEPGRPARSYVSDLGRELPRPITPEGVVGALVSPDGRSVITRKADGVFSVYSLEGGKPVLVPALQAEDSPIQWSEDGKTVYVRGSSSLPARIYRVDLANGRRELWRELAPVDSEGVFRVADVAITRDGRTCVYDYRRVLFDLYTIDGLR